LPSTDRIAVSVRESGDGWLAEVIVRDPAVTTHRVRVSKAERQRYGGGREVADLVRRSFDFLLAREPNTSILPEFDLSTIERYFPEYASESKRR
jgi:hypothetical protein